MKPEYTVGAPRPMGPGGFKLACAECGAAVYCRDKPSASAKRALCLECFVTLLEESEPGEFALILPPGWTPAMLVAWMKDGDGTTQ